MNLLVNDPHASPLQPANFNAGLLLFLANPPDSLPHFLISPLVLQPNSYIFEFLPSEGYAVKIKAKKIKKQPSVGAETGFFPV